MKRNIVLFVLILAVLFPFAYSVSLSRARAYDPATTGEEARDVREYLAGAVSARAAGRGNPWITLRDGHAAPVDYRGSSTLVSQLRDNQARPLSLASADFDEDGVPDLVAGYGGTADGVISIQRGDVDAIFPNTSEAIAHRKELRAPNPGDIQSPFFPASLVFDVPAAPDFIGTGDFDADGHRDVLAAQMGAAALVLLSGDGHGGFSPARSIALPGVVTALATGDANRMDGLADVIVAINGASGAKLLVYESSAGALNAEPEVLPLPSQSGSLAIGQLDDDYPVDMVVAAGRDLLIVHGRDRTASTPAAKSAHITRLSGLFPIASVAIGDFTGDLGNEVALLSDDGKCRVFSRDKSTKGGGWKETTTAALPVHNSPGVGLTPLLIPLRISSSPKDDLLLLDRAGRKLHMIINESAVAPENPNGPASTTLRVAGALDIDGEPVAVLGMRLNVDALSDLVVLKSDASAPIVIPTAPAATFTVINTNDAGTGSLREAMLSAGSNPGADLIDFAIPGVGTQTINLVSALPLILQPLTIDGTTQDEASATPPVELNGAGAPLGIKGLNLIAGNSTVRGLVINRFADETGIGIQLSGSNYIIEFNFIGTNATGTAALGNGDTGLLINPGIGHVIGGTTPAARNVISGNDGQGVQFLLGPAEDHQIQGNFIGTNAAGTAGIGNLADGIFMLSGVTNIMNCTVGGTTAGARNVISGNGGVGLEFLTVGTSNLVQGNFIGTDVTGTNDLGNALSGVSLSDAANNTIGGTVAGAGNVISGNNGGGVRINLAASTGNLVQGNKIGTRADGVNSLANSSHGVLTLNSASNNTIGGVAGGGNIIAFNTGAGVKIETGAGISTGNAVTTNSIFTNGGLGIDLGPAGVTANDGNDGDGGANGLQNFPVLTSAKGVVGGGVNIQGTLNSTANTTFTLHFYANAACDPSGNGEGQIFLGSGMATTVGNDVAFDITLPGASASVGQFITATATNPDGSTSEFSACVVYGAADLSISKTASSPTIVAGSNVTYTITLTNNGPDPASSVTVTDNLSSSLAFVSCMATGGGVCGGLGNNRTVSFATLASGASATITIVASLSCSVADGAIVGNTASVTSSVLDPTSGNNSSTVNFTASNPPREISPTSASYAADGGDGIVNVTAPSNCPWQVVSNDPWLIVTSGSFGVGMGTVSYDVEVNATGSPRIGTLTIAGLTFTVNQSNVSCQFTLMPTSEAFPAEGGEGSLSVTTELGCTWKVISNDTWIIPGDGGVGSGTANYTVEANAGSPRTGTMTIGGQTFTVDQAGGPTAVTLVSFTASEYDTGVVVQWRTGMEVENLGFRVYREHAGQRIRITPEIVAGSALMAGNSTTLAAGNSYAWWDGGIADCGSRIADCGANVSYWLEDVDLSGKATLYGPIAAQKVGGVPAQQTTAAVLSRVGRGEAKTTQLFSSSPSPVSQSQRLAATLWDLPSQPTIKLTIREEGWYRVTQPELVAAGLDPKADPRTLQVYVGGQERAVLVIGEQDGAFDQGDAIEFYAAGQDLPSTDTHTYWLVGGKQLGKRISSVRSDPEPGGARSFAYTLERKEKTIYFSSLRNGDAENFFGPVIASQPVDQELTLQHLDAAAPGEALLEIALQGVTDLPGIGPDHQVKVMLNGAPAGRMMFDGRQHSIEKFAVPHDLLREGGNVVTLIAEGGPSDITLVDYVRVTYRHTYTADQDALRMTIPEHTGPQTISGFSNGSIRVLDITDDGEPRELVGRIEQQKDGSFAVTVDVAGVGERTLMAFTEDRVKATVSTVANQVSSWRDSSHAADLLIITHRNFAASLAPLKALRQRQGFDVEVVDIEDIYDELGFGEKRPEAVKEFLSLIGRTWKRSPRFVLFVGDASYDARNYLGAGDSDFVPTKLIDTSYLETASDDWFADFNDDGLAEMFVGRLPVRTAAETAAVVSKIVGYDSAGGKSVARRSVLLVADKNDGFNFEQASEQLRSLVPAGVGVQEIFRGRMDDAAAKKQLIEAINSGKSIVNYIGHGSTNVWRDLFTDDDVRSLNNRKSLSLFVTMTCLNGFFHDPVTGSLGESLLRSERGGAIAVWASSGLTDPARQAAMNRQAYRLLFDTKAKLTLGEVTARAKSAVSDKDVRRTWLLLGDPTSRLR